MTPLLLGLALTVGAPGLKDRPKKADPLVGEWECVSRTFDGKPDATDGYRYVFAAGGEWAVYRGGRRVTDGGATYAADPTRDPAELDLKLKPALQTGQVLKAIYRIEGDTLTICLTGGPDRPSLFEAPVGSRIVKCVFKRAKTK